jgi:regulator of cell morphogenesis and NO signaling
MESSQQSLGELVTHSPGAAKVFHRHRLDFCCGGKQSLEEACKRKGIDPEAVTREIEGANSDPHGEVRWDQRPLDELVDYILTRYHAPLKEELPRLIELAGKVETVHADKPDRPSGLTALLEDVRESVDGHLAKEEQILFPLIQSGRGQMAHMPIHVMIQEHEDHGKNLQRIRELTHDLTLPEYACTSWRELYRSLQQLEVELMDHIHLENNILFPRAMAQ